MEAKISGRLLGKQDRLEVAGFQAQNSSNHQLQDPKKNGDSPQVFVTNNNFNF